MHVINKYLGESLPDWIKSEIISWFLQNFRRQIFAKKGKTKKQRHEGKKYFFDEFGKQRTVCGQTRQVWNGKLPFKRKILH